MLKNEITQALGAMELRFDQKNVELEYAPVTNYASKVVRRQQFGRNIAIWSAVVDAALAETGSVYFPASDEAYYIDRPIVLDSGMHVKADASAVIRLVDGAKTCMLRNLNLEVVHGTAPAGKPTKRDCDISVTGGVWDHASTKRNHADVKEDANPTLYQAWGLCLFLNVSRISFTDMRVMRSPGYGFLVANGEDLLVRGIRYEDCLSDGVHVQGPFKNIVIKDMSGVTGDDFFALTAWTEEVSEGPLDCAWVKGMRMEGGHRGMRLLASDGRQSGHPVTNVVVEDVTGTRDCKLYPCVPSGEVTRELGSMDWIYLENIDFLDSYALYGYRWNGCIQVHTNIGHLHLKNIRGCRPSVTVGPVAMAFTATTSPGYTLKFDADLDCTVDNLVLEDFPEDERNSIVELVSGKHGKGKVRNLSFK
jgi:hypothetical protein